jgi:small subunit ribosomal protein S16
MPVKIRLQRHGKKGKPFYWIVAADSRSKRDGKYLEKIGTYNPNVNPAEINLDIDGAVQWLNNGAQPTDTARAILSYKGVMLKKHLAGGVKKGAFTAEQAEEKFNTWLEGKNKEVEAKRSKLNDAEAKVKADALAAEKAVNEQRIADATAVEEVEEETAEAPSPDQGEETTDEVVEVSATEEAVEETAKEEE